MKKKKKILLIDDEVTFTNLVKLNLEESGKYEVRVENKGAEVVTAVLQSKPDLILLDIIMPDIEGSEVAGQIRANEQTKNIPIIFLTATILKEEIPQDGRIGGNLFISKPVSSESLISQIEKVIG